MARPTTAGRMATLGAAVFGFLVGACATNLPAPSGPAGSSGSPSAGASSSATPFPTLTATPASSPAPTAQPSDDGSGARPSATPQPTPDGVPTGTTGVDWQATVVSASLADVTQTPTGGLLAVGADPRGGVLWASNDGIDWTVVDDGPAFDRVRLTGIAAGDKLTIAIGCDLRDGKCTTPGVWVDRGNGWRRAATGSTFAHATLTDVAIDGDHAEILGRVRGAAALWRSLDGSTWTRVPDLPASDRVVLNGLIAGPDGFVAVGMDDVSAIVLVSLDGWGWSARTLDPKGELFDATLSGPQLVVAGQVSKAVTDQSGQTDEEARGAAWSSTDGATWEPIALPDGTNPIGNVALNGDAFVALNPGESCGTYGSIDAPTTDCIDQGDGTLTEVDEAIPYRQGFLLVGGHGIWSSPKVAVHEPLDPNTVIPAYGWNVFPLMPAVGRFTAAGVGEDVLVFSELGNSGALRVDDVDGSGRFRHLPAIAAGMTHPHAVATPSRVYLVGLDTSGTRGRFGVYDARRHSWQLLPALPTARDDPAVALGPDGRVYVLGGRRVPCCTVAQGGGAMATVERYDPKSNRWARLGPMPFASASAGAAQGNDTLFLFLPERVWTYDLAHDRWTAGPTTLTYGATGSPTQGQDGLIRVFTCDHYDIWDPGDGHWQPGRAFTSPRCGAVAAAQGAQIMLLGGQYTGNEGRSLESIDSGGG